MISDSENLCPGTITTNFLKVIPTELESIYYQQHSHQRHPSPVTLPDTTFSEVHYDVFWKEHVFCHKCVLR